MPGVERERPAFCASLGSLRDLSRLWLSFLDITRDGSVIQAAATKSVLLLWCEQVNTDRRPTDAAAPALWRAVRSGELTHEEAVSVAEQFNQQIGLTGLILTQMDGDARGGAALSIRAVTGVPPPVAWLGISCRFSSVTWCFVMPVSLFC